MCLTFGFAQWLQVRHDLVRATVVLFIMLVRASVPLFSTLVRATYRNGLNVFVLPDLKDSAL